MEKMTLTPFEDVLDEFYGKIGSPARDEHERKVDEAVHAYQIGEAVKCGKGKKRICFPEQKTPISSPETYVFVQRKGSSGKNSKIFLADS